MARKYIRLAPWDFTTYAPLGSAAFDNYVLDTRDRIRAVLDPGESNTDWIVGDVVKWVGFTNCDGYAFIIRHMSAGSATGPEWLFIIPGSGAGSATSEIEEILGSNNDATIANYLWGQSTSSNMFSFDGVWAVHYNPTGGTSTPYAGGTTWDGTGAVSGGDLSLPSVNPYSNIASFFPNTTQPVGAQAWDPGSSNTRTHVRIALVFDHAKPAMTWYSTYGRENYVHSALLMGEIIDPYLSSDTYTTGNLSIIVDAANVITQHRVSYYNSAGVRQLHDAMNYPTYMTRFNDQFASGDFAWDVVKVITPTEFKGYIDSDLVKVVGGTNMRFMELFEFDSEVLLKVTQNLAFPYTPTTPIFPTE